MRGKRIVRKEEITMKWRQFFTPVTSITWEEANVLVSENSDGGVVLLDVRQPGEYEKGHIPGATLIPLKEIDGRLDEIPRETPVVIY